MSSTEVIVPTYNNPRALDLCLCGLASQDKPDFSICIADDGSDDQTRQVVEKWLAVFGVSRFRHVWHPHEGFQKNKILNAAIASSVVDYLIFIDGDCIPRRDFIQRHLSARQDQRFLTGGVIRLPDAVTPSLTCELVSSGVVFTYRWLKQNRCFRRTREILKLGLLPLTLTNFVERITPVRKTWNGGNSSAWRRDLLSISGFNESLGYGGEDVELGIRLEKAGVLPRHIRYSAVLLHIEHPRNYVDQDQVSANKSRNEAARRRGA